MIKTFHFPLAIIFSLGIYIFGASQELRSREMVEFSSFFIDKTEVTIAQFARFKADTNIVTKAEKKGGGLVYQNGWERKKGWFWNSPYGEEGSLDEPAVHVTYDEASQYCKWAGKRLPTDAEWISAAYTEQRNSPSVPFQAGRTYTFPVGDKPNGANCLTDCGYSPTIDFSKYLTRGYGHERVAVTKAGVNGLYDMGANVWEWVDTKSTASKGTRGGSWWYGKEQMKVNYVASKPRGMSAVYIGFRCAKDKN